MTPSLMSNNDPVESPEPCGMSLDELKHLSDESLMVHLQAGHADVLSIILDRHYRHGEVLAHRRYRLEVLLAAGRV